MAVAIAPIIASAFVAAGVGAATAGILAQVVIIAVGLGISMLAQVLFGSKPAQPKPSDVQTILRQSTAPRFRSYGKVKVGGILMFANTSNGAYGRVIAMGSGQIDGVEEHWIDDHLVTLSGSAVTSAPFVVGGQSKAFIEWRLGENAPAPYASLVSTYPSLWTNNHLGKGIPSAFLVLHQLKSEDMGNTFPQYANTGYRQVQRGARVPDVFGGALTTPTYSDNAARILIDYLTHPDGLRLDQTWITNAHIDWAAAIAACDEPIALVEGGTEPRYRIWNTYQFSERPADILTRFLHACDGAIFPTPERGLSIKVGKWSPPSVTIDDDAILGFSEFGRGRDVLTTANIIRARYTSADHDYLETDADPWIDDVDVGERGELVADLDLFAVPSHAQTRRLLKIAAARANPAWVGILSCNLRALPCMGERFINVQISELGINQTFEVLSVQLTIEQGSILTGVRVQVASIDASAYDWAAVATRGLARSGDEGTPPSVPPAILRSNTIPVPTGITTTVDGTMIAVAWATPPEDYLRGEVQYKQAARPGWLAAPVAADQTVVHVGPLADSTEYQFRVRHRSETSSRVSLWSATYTATTDDAPADPRNIVRVVTPVSGATVVMGSGERSIYVLAAGPLAALTIRLPGSPAFGPVETTSGSDLHTTSGSPVIVVHSGQTPEILIDIGFRYPVTALTVLSQTGAAIPNAPTTASGPGVAIFFRWIDEVSNWVPWK